MSMLPLRTKIRGPAPPLASPSDQDIVDEAIELFRINALFRNFEIKGGADRVLIYLIMFISDCLTKIASPPAKGWSANEATKQLTSYAVDNFSLPGEPGFPLNNLYQAPATRPDADNLRQYLLQARQETAIRLVARVYDTPDGKPSKWWMCFQKRKFMGKSLTS
ncbi:ARP2/3 complex, 21 kDa p21-Arc subunit [Atractiella rhizophila]|nr:ARP2/3 complex, 21 kDa p21-Arc subunit [Atractiella rhizophila]